MTFYPIGVTPILKEDLEEAAVICGRMTKFGHAVVFDLHTDENNKFLSAQVFHYKTCKTCTENQRKEG